MDTLPTSGDELNTTNGITTADQPLVSVVIPTMNSARTLARCIQSIRAQTYQNLEIIVVDNHSSDDTQRIATDLADSLIVAGDERAAQTNAGVKAAHGEWVYRVDSDFVVNKDVVSQAIATALATDRDAILIHNESDPSVSFWARARNFERSMYKGDDTNVATRFMKKSVFEGVGGFDEDLIAGEDYDLHIRVVNNGARMGRIDASELHLGEPRSLKEVVEKHFFYGREMRRYTKKHKRESVTQLNPVRPAFVRNWKMMLAHPGQSAAMVIYLFFKYVAGGLGYAIGPKKEGKRQ